MCSLTSESLREIRLHIQHTTMHNEHMRVHDLVGSVTSRSEPWSDMLKHFGSLPILALLNVLEGLVVCPDFFLGIEDH